MSALVGVIIMIFIEMIINTGFLCLWCSESCDERRCHKIKLLFYIDLLNCW